jgi:hypothetical protein
MAPFPKVALAFDASRFSQSAKAGADHFRTDRQRQFLSSRRGIANDPGHSWRR